MFKWCVSLSGVSVLLQSISLYIWLVRQPIRCIRFILIYWPIESLGMGPYVPIAISVAIGRDWLVRCYRAFVHVGAYSVIGRLLLNHVLCLDVDPGGWCCCWWHSWGEWWCRAEGLVSIHWVLCWLVGLVGEPP